MIQTSFFPQPKKDEPVKIIQVNPSGLQPRKVEELLPDDNIKLDTYIIYPTGGYHPFYGTLNTLPRYQLPIWPYVKRIKFSEKYHSQETADKGRSSNTREHHTTNQINPSLVDNLYLYLNFDRNDIYTRNWYNVLRKNGKHAQGKTFSQKRISIHRVVALAFIPNPENKPIVMHINDDTTNFLIENLKWGTTGENAKGTIKRRPDTMEQKYLNLVDKGIIKG
jgi:hypothetical protein